MHYARTVQYAPANQFRSPSQTVGSIIRGFKSAVTKQINKIRDTTELSVWQRGYYDHIVRDDIDLNRVREYIQNNPVTWSEDENFQEEE